VGDQEHDGWLSPLYPALYPPTGKWHRSDPAPGCPSFGSTTVFNRPPDISEVVSVRPGLHRARVGSHDVVWFDPAALNRGVEKKHGLENEDVLVGTPEQTAAGLRSYEEWMQRRASLIQLGTTHENDIGRAVDMETAAEAGSISVEVISLGGAPVRPSGWKFGRLVHAILRNPQTSAGVQKLAQTCGRALGASVEEIQAAADVAERALLHPALNPVNAVRFYRELPVMVRMNDGTLVEGNLDFAWTDGETWTVVDYKTDSANAKRYRAQIQLYAYALQQATGLPARGILLEI
jgi:ATP-dependent helicase/nuclease subunit A